MTDFHSLIAHVYSSENLHFLSEHLQETARIASKFASKFNSSDWGYILGLAHDAGKSSDKWQDYIKAKSGYDVDAHLENISSKLDHSSSGAKLAEEVFGECIGRVLSYCIAGHHTGLPDGIPGEGVSLYTRLKRADTTEIHKEILSSLQEKNRPDSLAQTVKNFVNDNIGISLWIRMLFSALVDADFLDTEKFMNISQSQLRGEFETIESLSNKLLKHLEQLGSSAEKSQVNELRRQILSHCLQKAQYSPGFYSLTVPTGGGKTLSGLAFALEHARIHKKDRIIYVVPYTTIIEQNSQVFKSVLGNENIIEHHSNFIEEGKTNRTRLACENWDAPVIVTTTVQFFESLFAAKPSRCRKLHNICNSIVILDEAQLIPLKYLLPIRETLKLLVKQYSMTLLIATATQPSLSNEWDISEIIPDPERLYRELKRVNISIPSDLEHTQSWEDIASEISKYKQVLCVVVDRKGCKKLHSLMPEGTYHLSALMCPEHRSHKIQHIKEDLDNNKTVRVISTQLVEAGVDIDFPVVYKALAGIDSISQAAGRCNREGRLGSLGKVVVFVPPSAPPLGILRKARDTSVDLFSNSEFDWDNPHIFSEFWERLCNASNSLDKKDIIQKLRINDSELSIDFRTVAKEFKLIDDENTQSIFIPYNEGSELIQEIKEKGINRYTLRKLQRFSISIYHNQFEHLQKNGFIENLSTSEDLFALTIPIEYNANNRTLVSRSAQYSIETGLMLDNELFRPSDYMI